MSIIIRSLQYFLAFCNTHSSIPNAPPVMMKGYSEANLFTRVSSSSENRLPVQGHPRQTGPGVVVVVVGAAVMVVVFVVSGAVVVVGAAAVAVVARAAVVVGKGPVNSSKSNCKTKFFILSTAPELRLKLYP